MRFITQSSLEFQTTYLQVHDLTLSECLEPLKRETQGLCQVKVPEVRARLQNGGELVPEVVGYQVKVGLEINSLKN